MNRESVVDDEFLRATPGLRPFSVGILRIARKMGLKMATGEKGGDSTREVVAMAWMLDLKTPIEKVKELADSPKELAAILDDYEFTIAPRFLVDVQNEIARTNRAIEAVNVVVETKPGATAGPAEPKNS
jgi:hypothetical protein